jgi:hypothetical protein
MDAYLHFSHLLPCKLLNLQWETSWSDLLWVAYTLMIWSGANGCIVKVSRHYCCTNWHPGLLISWRTLFLLSILWNGRNMIMQINWFWNRHAPVVVSSIFFYNATIQTRTDSQHTTVPHLYIFLTETEHIFRLLILSMHGRLDKLFLNDPTLLINWPMFIRHHNPVNLGVNCS